MEETNKAGERGNIFAGDRIKLRIEFVRDIPEDYTLISDSQDIRATLESIGEIERLEDVGCLFAKVGDGDYEAVYMCTRSVPVLDARVYQLA